jgi:hypothetical protein
MKVVQYVYFNLDDQGQLHQTEIERVEDALEVDWILERGCSNLKVDLYRDGDNLAGFVFGKKGKDLWWRIIAQFAGDGFVPAKLGRVI